MMYRPDEQTEERYEFDDELADEALDRDQGGFCPCACRP